MVARPSPEEFKELVQTRTDIVRLMSESIALTFTGQNYEGTCAFHPGHRPAPTVNFARQTYRCEACGEAGDCFAFFMRQNSVDLATSRERLAQRVGLTKLSLDLGYFE